MFLKEKETLHKYANVGEEKLRPWEEQLASLRESALQEFQKWKQAKQSSSEREAGVLRKNFEQTKASWEKLLGRPLFS